MGTPTVEDILALYQKLVPGATPTPAEIEELRTLLAEGS